MQINLNQIFFTDYGYLLLFLRAIFISLKRIQGLFKEIPEIIIKLFLFPLQEMKGCFNFEEVLSLFLTKYFS